MKNKNFPQIKKDFKVFLTSEEGKIVEKDAVKLGIILLTAAGVLGGLMKSSDVSALTCNQTCCHESHASHSSAPAGGGGGGGCSTASW